MTPAVPASASSPSEPELLALVRSIHLARKTGLVEVDAGGSEKHLYFVSGELYLLASAPSTRRIARLLKMRVWGDQGSRQTLDLLSSRIAERFSSWRTRSYSFTEGFRAPARQLVGPLPTAQILMAAASDEGAFEPLRERLSAPGVRLVAEQSTGRPVATSICPDQTALLASLERPMELDELLGKTEEHSPEVLARIIRLWAAGLIREESEEPVESGREEAGGAESGTDQVEAGDGPAASRDEIQAIWRRHFGLETDPFSLTPDPAFLFISEGHGEALAGLKLGLLERRGLLAMTGEVGTGKTTLLYALLSGLKPEIEAAYIYNTTLCCEEILQSALLDFGVPYTGSSRLDLLETLNDYLARLATTDRTAALVIDEAQNLSDDTFEQLRLLLNFETYDRKLLQIVLVGQPELAKRLRAPELRQIADRIAVRCRLEPLSKDEAQRYVRHRLTAAGGSSEVFSRQALRLVVHKTRGIPRRINVVCHNAMLFAFAAGERRVGRAYVREALREIRASGLETALRRPTLEQGFARSAARGLLERLPRALRRPTSLWLGAALTISAWLSLSLGSVPAERQDPGALPNNAFEARPVALEPAPSESDPLIGPAARVLDRPVPDSPKVPRTEDAAAPEPRLGATATNLRLRSGPGLEAPVITVLPPDSRVSVLEARGEWLRVVTIDTELGGWVSRLYVAYLEEGAPPAGAAADSALPRS